MLPVPVPTVFVPGTLQFSAAVPVKPATVLFPASCAVIVAPNPAAAFCGLAMVPHAK